METTILKQLKNENLRLQNEIVSMRESFRFECDVTNNREMKLISETVRQDALIDSLGERVHFAEKQKQVQQEELNRSQAELQVASAQLRAMRLENRHLRRSGSSSNSDAINKTDSDRHLQEIQNAYSDSLRIFEVRNAQLEAEVTRLKEELNKAEENTRTRIQTALGDSERTIKLLREDENRRVAEVTQLSRRQVESSEGRLRETMLRYEADLEKLQTRIFHLEDELETRNRSLAKLGRENEAMSNYVNGVDDIVRSPIGQTTTTSQCSCTPRSEDSFKSARNNNQCVSMLNSQGGVSVVLEDEDLSVRSVDVATEEYLQQQQSHMQQLESIINFQVDELRNATDTTLKKYTIVR